MPGICLWLSNSDTAREMRARFERAQTAMIHGPGYRTEVYAQMGGCLIGTTTYPGYPTRMFKGDKHSVVLEGQIYNKSASQLETELMALAGIVLSTADDVSREVGAWILGADGDFAVVMVSADGSRIAVINDYLGRLPIYLRRGTSGLVVARECKFITLISGDCGFDQMAWAQQLWLGYPLGRRTLFNGIERAPGALFLTAWIRGEMVETISRQTWCMNLDAKDDRPGGVKERGAELADLVCGAVARRARVHADVANVLSLSGGHDSRTIAAALCDGGYRFVAASQGRPDVKSRADARAAARIAAILHVDWDLVPLATTNRDEEELVWLKDGLNYVGTAFMLPYLRAIRGRWGAGAVYWTGDGGDKIFPDLRPSRAVRSQDALTEAILAKHELTAPALAEAVIGLPKGSVLEELRTIIEAYPEEDFRQKAIHFALYERGAKWLFEGEDRNRFILWQVSPFYATPLFARAMEIPDRLKAGYRLYREVQLALSSSVARIAHAEVRVPIASPLFAWKLRFDAAARRLPRPLKTALRQLVQGGQRTGDSSPGSRTDWVKAALAAISRGLPMRRDPMASFVQRANTHQFDSWRTLVLLEQLRCNGKYTSGRWRSVAN